MGSSDALFTGRFFRMWSFSFFTFFTAFQLLPTIPFRILDLGGTKAEAGLFLAIYTYACAFSAPVTGTIADRVGPRKLLVVGSIAFFAGSLLYAVITNLVLLLVVACVHGIFWSAILSSGAAVMAEVIPVSRRTEGMGYWGMASTAAIAIAPLAGLTVYRRGWSMLCVEMAVLSLLMLVLAMRVRGGAEAHAHPIEGLSSLVDWRVMVTALTLFVVSFSYGGITSYVALLAKERAIEPTSLFFTVFAVTILVTRIATGPLGDRIGPARLLIPSVLIVPVAVAVLAVTKSVVGMSVAAFLYGLGFGGAYPAFVAHVLAYTDERRRGATFGSILWAFDTGIGSGSLIAGIAAQQIGFRAAFLLAAGVSALSVPIFFATAGVLRRADEQVGG